MSTYRKQLEEVCSWCGTKKERVYMKNPFIDDSADECPRCEPGEAVGLLNAAARAVARRDEE